MGKKLYLTTFLLSALFCYAQNFDNYISGRITELGTGKPIPGVQVYLNETTHGTTSDLKGYFKIREIIPGSHELIASMIGFNIFSKVVEIASTTKMDTDIELEEKLYDFGTVTVTAEKPTGWLSDLAFFKRLFLGNSSFANDCIIENEYMLNFESEGDKFTAKASEPLIIKNFSLGYEMSCDLVEFNYNEGSKSVNYLVKTFFTEIEEDTPGKKDYWKLNRQMAYSGSLTHFLKSLVGKNLEKEGFHLSFTQDAYSEIGDPLGFKEVKEDRILDIDEHGYMYTINFPDFLKVVFVDPVTRLYKLSYIKLRYAEAPVDAEGNSLAPNPFQTYGEWSKKGIADMMPRGYNIEIL